MAAHPPATAGGTDFTQPRRDGAGSINDVRF
jgi:hypothetical protein